MRRIKDVERECQTIRWGTDRLLSAVSDDPSLLRGHIKQRDIRAASANLEGTFLVRIFSEFETALQQFIRDSRLRRPRTAESMVNRVRAEGSIPLAETDAVHRVREYRNTLVHQRANPAPAVTIRQATSALCTFLSRVQGIW
ncbi:hypothetical protein [Aquisphaera insulae]|uniref:hypothetical protein n=1 Tax=Aquisphaera insulae TaxID=2712864 RepID=UPI0013EC6CEF|nr:hypothetical protein [Aquisphaera insulae]